MKSFKIKNMTNTFITVELNHCAVTIPTNSISQKYYPAMHLSGDARLKVTKGFISIEYQPFNATVITLDEFDDGQSDNSVREPISENIQDEINNLNKSEDSDNE